MTHKSVNVIYDRNMFPIINMIIVNNTIDLFYRNIDNDFEITLYMNDESFLAALSNLYHVNNETDLN